MLNKVILQARLCTNPDLKYTQSGTPIANLYVASNRRFKQGEDMKDETCFVEVVAFGKQAEHCGQYLAKGSHVLIEGRLQYQMWETEKGEKRTKHALVAESVTFLDKKGDSHE